MKGNQQYSAIRSIRGPVTLITLGILFAAQNFTPYGFDQTWPVLLIVFGLLSLLGRAAAPPPQPPPPMAAPPYSWQPPPPPPVPGTGYRGTTYSQSTYAQPGPVETSSGPAKGGFGTTPPPRSSENPPESSNPGGGV